MDRRICIMYSFALFIQSEHGPIFLAYLIINDPKTATTASLEIEKITISSSRDFPTRESCDDLHIETLKRKWKGRSINIICINRVCAEVIHFHLPSYPLCIVCFTPCGMAAVLALSMDQQLGTLCHSPQQPSSRPLFSSFAPMCLSSQSNISKSLP